MKNIKYFKNQILKIRKYNIAIKKLLLCDKTFFNN